METLTKLGSAQRSLGSELGLSKCRIKLQSTVRASHCLGAEAGARPSLGPPDPDSPFCGTQMQERLLKTINAALFTKEVAQAGSAVPGPQPAIGGRVGGWRGVSQLSPGGKAKPSLLWGQCSLLGPSWGSCPVAAGASTAVSGRHFQLWGPKKNCRTRSARSATEVQEEDLAMTSLNCGAGSAGESGAQTGPGWCPGTMATERLTSTGMSTSPNWLLNPGGAKEQAHNGQEDTAGSTPGA